MCKQIAQYDEARNQYKLLKNSISPNDFIQKEDIEMKNIILRKDGRYMANFTLNKKRYYVYDKNKKKCYSKLIKLKKQLTAIEEKKEKSPNKTKNFFEFAKIWYQKFKINEVGYKTKELYSSCLKNHLSKIKEDFKDLTTIKLQNYLNKLGNTRTKEIAYITIKQIFRKALELGYIKTNPAEFLIKGKIERKERLNFSLDEQKKILANIDDSRISKLILFYLLTGARLSEAIKFNIKDIKGDYIFINGTKTKKAKRYVKVSKKLITLLLDFNVEQPFKTDVAYIQKKFKEFCNKAGIKGTIHQLRHTFASNLYYLQVPDKQRQEYLGHSSIAITNDIYTHLDPTITKEDILNLYIDLYPNF